MTMRAFTGLLAGLLLFHFAGTARAQDQQLAPVQDPLGIYRQAQPIEQAPEAPPPPPKPVAAPPLKKDVLRNDKPMEDFTELFDRKDFVVDNGKDPKHSITYFWKAPKGVVPGAGTPQLYPLVIVLHNAAGLAQAAESLMRRDNRRDFPAFILVPALPAGQLWAFPESFPDDARLSYLSNQKQRLPDVMELLPDLLKDNPIDGRRIYVIGCAEGGFGAYGAAMNYPDIFAAAVPINGGWAIKSSNALTKIPLFIQHGDKDETFPPSLSRDVAYYIQLYHGNVHYLQVPGLGHDCADERLYTRTMWAWMFQQKKKHGVVVKDEPEENRKN